MTQGQASAPEEKPERDHVDWALVHRRYRQSVAIVPAERRAILRLGLSGIMVIVVGCNLIALLTDRLLNGIAATVMLLGLFGMIGFGHALRRYRLLRAHPLIVRGPVLAAEVRGGPRPPVRHVLTIERTVAFWIDAEGRRTPAPHTGPQEYSVDRLDYTALKAAGFATLICAHDGLYYAPVERLLRRNNQFDGGGGAEDDGLFPRAADDLQ